MTKHARLVTGLFAIILLLFVWVYHLAEARSLTRSLQTEATALQATFARRADDTPAFDTTVETVAARNFPLLGGIQGKVTVYVRASGAGDARVYSAFEHFFVYEEGQWRMTESGTCSGPECQSRASRAFQKRHFMP